MVLGADNASLMTGDIPALLYDETTGEFLISDQKSAVKMSWQVGRYKNMFPFSLAANETGEFNVRVNPEDGLKGDTEISSFLITTTGRLSVQPFIPLLNKQLSNVPICHNLMFGTSQLPALLAQTIYTFPSVDWVFTFRDLSGSTNVISPVFHGRRFIDRQKERLRDSRQSLLLNKFMHPYWLGPSTGVLDPNGTPSAVQGGAEITLAAGATMDLFFPVPGDAAFNCFWILDDSTSTTGSEPVLTAQIFEGDTGSPWNDVPMSWRDFLASGTYTVSGFPGNRVRAASLPSPGGCWSALVEKSTKMRVRFTSGDAGTITIRCAFVGVLLYAPEPIAQQIVVQSGDAQAALTR